MGVHGSTPEPTVASKVADSSNTTGSTARAPLATEPVAMPGSPATDEEPPAKHTEEEIDHEVIERFVGDAVVRELYHKAASCYRGQPDTGSIEVQYGLRVSDGSASIHGATLHSSSLGDRELEDCVVRAIDGHTWTVSDGFTVDEPRETALFTVPGLRKLSRAEDDDSQ